MHVFGARVLLNDNLFPFYLPVAVGMKATSDFACEPHRGLARGHALGLSCSIRDRVDCMVGLAFERGDDVACVEAAGRRLEPGDHAAFALPRAGGVSEAGEAARPADPGRSGVPTPHDSRRTDNEKQPRIVSCPGAWPPDRRDRRQPPADRSPAFPGGQERPAPILSLRSSLGCNAPASNAARTTFRGPEKSRDGLPPTAAILTANIRSSAPPVDRSRYERVRADCMR